MEVLFGAFFALVVFALLIAIYFLPTIVAVRRNHRNRTPIILVNIFLGWMFIGWVVALVWAFTSNTESV